MLTTKRDCKHWQVPGWHWLAPHSRGAVHNELALIRGLLPAFLFLRSSLLAQKAPLLQNCGLVFLLLRQPLIERHNLNAAAPRDPSTDHNVKAFPIRVFRVAINGCLHHHNVANAKFRTVEDCGIQAIHSDEEPQDLAEGCVHAGDNPFFANATFAPPSSIVLRE